MIVYKDNLPDFKRQMAAAGEKIGKKVVAGATRAAAAEYAREVRRFAPRRSGRLARAVVIKRARRVPRGTVQYIVGIRQGASQQRIQRVRKGVRSSVNLDAFYWFFQEAGWVPRQPKAALRGGPRTKALQARRARSGGGRVVRHPFIAPAFTSASGRALSAFYRAMDEGLKEIK